MSGMGLGGGYGAGEGADMLQRILLRVAQEEQAKERAAAEQQRIALATRAQEGIEGERAYQREQDARPKAPAVHNVGGRLVDDTGAVRYEPPAAPEKPMIVGGRVLSPDASRVLYEPPAETQPVVRLGPGGLKTLGEVPKGTHIVNEPQAPSGGEYTSVQQGIGPDGKPAMLIVDRRTGQAKPVQMPGGYAPNRPARPVTGSERQALAYYNRAKEASETVNPLEDGIAKLGLGGQAALQYLPNFMQSQEGQSYRQAQRAFTEARLRKESGAAIPQQEYDNDARTYFAQPGDSAQTLEQKRKARATVLDGMKISAGGAYQEHYGDEAAAAQPAPGQPGASGGQKVGDKKTFPNGAIGVWDGKGWVKQ